MGGEQPRELGLVDLGSRDRVLRVRLERAVQLREKVAALVEQEDVIVHEQGVLGAHPRHRRQPRVKWVAKRVDGHEDETTAPTPTPTADAARRRAVAAALRCFLQRAVVLGGLGVAPRRAWVGVQHAHALWEHVGEVSQLPRAGRRDTRRHRSVTGEPSKHARARASQPQCAWHRRAVAWATQMHGLGTCAAIPA